MVSAKCPDHHAAHATAQKRSLWIRFPKKLAFNDALYWYLN